jgi:predicted exporter
VIPRGVIDARQLSEIAAAQDDLAFIDLRAASENIVVAFRSEAMQWMLIGSGVALALLFGALRNAVAVARTALPVVASITATVAVLLAAGETLSLFHLLALLLIGGLAIDYGLVLGLHAQTADDWRQSLRGVTFSAMTSFVPFALLGFSGVPVLHQIGLTVAVGIVFSLAFAQFLNNGNFQWQTA